MLTNWLLTRCCVATYSCAMMSSAATISRCPHRRMPGASITQSSVVIAAQVTLSRRSAPCAYSSAVRRSAASSMSRVSWLSFMRVPPVPRAGPLPSVTHPAHLTALFQPQQRATQLQVPHVRKGLPVGEQRVPAFELAGPEERTDDLRGSARLARE